MKVGTKGKPAEPTGDAKNRSLSQPEIFRSSRKSNYNSHFECTRRYNSAQPGVAVPTAFQFSDYVLDSRRFELRRGVRTLKLEKIPMELLILLVERQGDLVSRDEIVEKLWGKDVFLEADHGINTAVSKLRQVLRDDPERPQYIQTVVGKGYRFIASTSLLQS